MSCKNHLPKILFSYCPCPVLYCLSILNVSFDFSPNLMELKALPNVTLSAPCNPSKHLPMLSTHQSSPNYLSHLNKQVMLKLALHLGLLSDFSQNIFSCYLPFVEMHLWIHIWPPLFLNLINTFSKIPFPFFKINANPVSSRRALLISPAHTDLTSLNSKYIYH